MIAGLVENGTCTCAVAWDHCLGIWQFEVEMID